jgi:hypothetical protein
MATIEIYGPSSHSQTVDVPATIEAKADVTNHGGAFGYARMFISSVGFQEWGNVVGIGRGKTYPVRATYRIGTNYEGQTLTVAAHLYEVTAYGSVIRHIGTPHLNFRITVEKPYVPPYIEPWYWEEEEQEQDDDTGNGTGGNGTGGNGDVDTDTSEAEAQESADSGEEGGDYADYGGSDSQVGEEEGSDYYDDPYEDDWSDWDYWD